MKETPTLESPEAASAFVAARLAEGSDFLEDPRRRRAFHMTDRGQIATGLRADLLLVDGDPTKDIRATRKTVRIWKNGVARD